MRRLIRPAAVISLALLIVLVALWIAAINGHPTSPDLARGLALAAVALAAAAGVGRLITASTTGRIVFALAVLALALRWVGAEFEVGGYYYGDEGVYAQRVSEINGGQPLPQIFIYPHLLFYVEAFVNWLVSHWPDQVLALATRCYGITDYAVAMRLVYRLVVATFGALTVVPVALGAHAIAGAWAGRVAGLAMALSPIYDAGSKLNICDVPSAFFAALCGLYIARLTTGESTRWYLLAGVASGLAACSKYPAGVVAVGIVAVWGYWRWRHRNLNLGLLWAGLASLGSFVAAMPALVLHSEQALFSKTGLFFGVKLYAEGGWIGVVPRSNTVYYLGLLRQNFGALLVVLGLGGIALMLRHERIRLLLLLPFPVVFLGILATMNIVVDRTVYPIIPVTAVILGCGFGAVLTWVRARTAWPVALAVAALGLAEPAYDQVLQNIAHARPSTRDLAASWIWERIPVGSRVLKESYTPGMDRKVFRVIESKFGCYVAPDKLVEGFDYAILSSDAYHRFLVPDFSGAEHHQACGDWYRDVFERFPVVAEFAPGKLQAGPRIVVHRIAPDPVTYHEQRVFAATEVFLPGQWKLQKEGHVWFGHPGRWTVVSEFLRAGWRRLHIDGGVEAPAKVTVVDDANTKFATVSFDGTSSGVFELPRDGRYWFILELGERSYIHHVGIAGDGVDPTTLW